MALAHFHTGTFFVCADTQTLYTFFKAYGIHLVLGWLKIEIGTLNGYNDNEHTDILWIFLLCFEFTQKKTLI